MIIQPFTQTHIEDAAQLFITHYKTQRAPIPYLPSTYANRETIAGLLANMLQTNPGVVALSKSKLVGYLTGYAKIPYFKGLNSGAYSPEWAHAVLETPERERVFQSMYTHIAHTWVHAESVTHAITFFASDTALRDLLYWNGFGMLVVDAIRPTATDDLDEAADLGDSITIRRANEGDADALVRLDSDLTQYLARSPTFLFTEDEDPVEIAQGFLADDAFSAVAEKDQQLLACIRGQARKEDSCTIVQDASITGIDFAYTAPQARSTGIGKRLLREVLCWGHARGQVGCAVDFESANVLGRAFWLKHFTPLCFSAIRYVDPRVTDMGKPASE